MVAMVLGVCFGGEGGRFGMQERFHSDVIMRKSSLDVAIEDWEMTVGLQCKKCLSLRMTCIRCNEVVDKSGREKFFSCPVSVED